jgi:hypothetical protein
MFSIIDYILASIELGVLLLIIGFFGFLMYKDYKSFDKNY